MERVDQAINAERSLPRGSPSPAAGGPVPARQRQKRGGRGQRASGGGGGRADARGGMRPRSAASPAPAQPPPQPAAAPSPGGGGVYAGVTGMDSAAAEEEPVVFGCPGGRFYHRRHDCGELRNAATITTGSAYRFTVAVRAPPSPPSRLS